MTESNDIHARYERYLQAQAAANAQNKNLVFDALAAAGLTSVTVTFDGYGDSGQIENVEWQPSAQPPDSIVALRSANSGGNLNDEAQPITLAEAVEDLCYAYLGQDHCGWQDNDGSFGEFVFDVAKRTVELTFNCRFTDHETSEHSY